MLRQWWQRWWRRIAVASCVLAAITLWLRLGPIDPSLLDLSDTTSTVVVDRRGVSMRVPIRSAT